jgi:ABC-type nitrate/sulfonate/bicarbonate transport system permease component
MFAAMFGLALMGAGVYGGMSIVERLALRWWRGR